MTNIELTALLENASDYAEQAYYEVFHHQADLSQSDTRMIVEAFMHAWLSGYSYLYCDPCLDNIIFDRFGYTCEVSY